MDMGNDRSPLKRARLSRTGLPVRVRPGKRLSSAGTAMRASSRATLRPAQVCIPPAKAMWLRGLRVMSSRSGSGYTAGSRFAAPMAKVNAVPAGMLTSSNCTAAVVALLPSCTGASYLSISSMTESVNSGFSFSSCNWSG